MIIGMHHVGVVTEDAERLAGFYKRQLLRGAALENSGGGRVTRR